MNIKTVVLKSLGITDEGFIMVPVIGILTWRQAILLLSTFFISFAFIQTGNIIIVPFVVAAGLYMAFVKGKTFSPNENIMNYFSFVKRNLIKSDNKTNKIFKIFKRNKD